MVSFKTGLKVGLLVLVALGALGSPLLAAPQVAEAKGSAAGKQVDINTADAAELQSVPGIGEVLAKRIVEHREANGKFRRLEDLMRVRGIGEKSFVKLKPYLKLAR